MKIFTCLLITASFATYIPCRDNLDDVPDVPDLPDVPDVDCEWPGHCAGASCQNDNQCSDVLTCNSGVCGGESSDSPTEDDPPTEDPEVPKPSEDCDWPGHCAGASCQNDNQCSDVLTCNSGVCGGESSDSPTDDQRPSTDIPVSSGDKATITAFDDTVFECTSGPITEPALAVNPLLLGFTAQEYADFNDQGVTPPWCGMKITLTVNGKSFTGRVIDTCNPLDGEGFPDPETGESIGVKCDFEDVLDIYQNEAGQKFLDEALGDDFFGPSGDVQWSISSVDEDQDQDQEDPSRYPSGTSCASGGTYSVNEFGADICEYPATACPITKYFTYPDGGNGVELCCSSNSDCDYEPVKNYCHPDLKRCVDGSYFGCSEKAGPIFESCL